jgi:hypothetical protein
MRGCAHSRPAACKEWTRGCSQHMSECARSRARPHARSCLACFNYDSARTGGHDGHGERAVPGAGLEHAGPRTARLQGWVVCPCRAAVTRRLATLSQHCRMQARCRKPTCTTSPAARCRGCRCVKQPLRGGAYVTRPRACARLAQERVSLPRASPSPVVYLLHHQPYRCPDPIPDWAFCFSGGSSGEGRVARVCRGAAWCKTDWREG